MADNSAPRNPHVRPGSKSAKGSLDTPAERPPADPAEVLPEPGRLRPDHGRLRPLYGHAAVPGLHDGVLSSSGWPGTPLPRRTWQFDSRALGFTLLTLMLSLQASYAAPLLLLAQNRQDDRDRVSLQQDRQRAERNLSDTEYLTRELASLRIALREVATRDYVRAELRSLLEDMLEAQEELRTHDPSGRRPRVAAGQGQGKAEGTPRQAAQPPDPANPPGQGRPQERPQNQQEGRHRAGHPARRRAGHRRRPGTPCFPRELSIHRMNPTQDSTRQQHGHLAGLPSGEGRACRTRHRDRPRTPPSHHRAGHGGRRGGFRRRPGADRGAPDHCRLPPARHHHRRLRGGAVRRARRHRRRRRAEGHDAGAARRAQGAAPRPRRAARDPVQRPRLADQGVRRRERQGRRGQVLRDGEPRLRAGRPGAARGDRGRGRLRLLRPGADGHHPGPHPGG